MSDLLTLAQAHAACGSTFVTRVRNTAGEVCVQLLLEQATESPARSGYVQFALLFTAPAAQPLVQATFLLTHDTLGETPVFLVPVGQRGELIEYEAVFSYPEPTEPAGT